MRWFKHPGDSLHKAEIEKLIMKYGIEGYGLYYACVEMIAGALTAENPTFELKHDAEILAHKFKIDTIKVENIMKYCIELGLFEMDSTTQRVHCFAILQMLDVSTSNNPEIKKIKNSSNYQKLLESNSRLDKTREEETNKDIYIPEKEKNSNNINEELINKVLTVWNNQSHLTTHNLSTVTRKFQKKHITAINDIGLDKVLKSIANYGKIVGDPDMWYDYRFSLWDFIVKALERFLDEAKPFENYRMKKKNFEQKKEFEDPYLHPDRERERIDDIDV